MEYMALQSLYMWDQMEAHLYLACTVYHAGLEHAQALQGTDNRDVWFAAESESTMVNKALTIDILAGKFAKLELVIFVIALGLLSLMMQMMFFKTTELLVRK